MQLTFARLVFLISLFFLGHFTFVKGESEEVTNLDGTNGMDLEETEGTDPFAPYKCVRECTDIMMETLKSPAAQSNIGKICESYHDYVTCIRICPMGEEVWNTVKKAMKGQVSTIESSCRNTSRVQGERRRHRRALNQKLEMMTSFGNRVMQMVWILRVKILKKWNI